MNLELQSTGKSTMNGLRGINAKTETSATCQSKSHERSAQFRDLLDQSKQDIKQADHHLEKARENRRESKSIAESNRREDNQRSPKDIEVKLDNGQQAEEPVTEELNNDKRLENSSLPTLDAAQLIGIQSFQGGIETALTRLNLKLGLEENKEPEGLTVQAQVIELTDMDNQSQSMPVLESIPQFDETVNDEVQVLQQNIGIVENEEVESLSGLLKNSGSELAATEDVSDEVNFSQELVNQTRADDDPESQISGGVRQMNEDQTVADKSETLINAIGGTDSTKEQSSEQTKVIEVQANSLNQTEDQNPGEKGVQEINVTSINTDKGPEVQPNAKVAVAQQVEQKILQNFEPNKPMVLQMTLSPDNLGDIDIKLSYDQGKLIIDITAVSQETQNLLGKQINLLVRGLALQNVQVETVHLNTPVEQSSDSQDATFMNNSGSDPNQNQNQTLLRERFIKNSGVLNSILTSSDEDESVMIPQNLQNYTNHKVNYLI
ncbi:flagellar hook-length control protein FliK [Acetobacterium sp.]|jgi:flagellar hook-length control protein FliK|uniref:flagellar hook-length control protein FliK n=1 Tax=Acetobacterium sp. TaxID=1872094 RepID=UPI00272630FF|nr:flagellar hook-length control protein FliK [Acetobacterium sp.]MDO9493800.1 flagellar hook-length control protein FliK [Acetobacterium sp.]